MTVVRRGPAATIDDRELAEIRRHGFGVAYRMLASVSDAEDVVQEAMLRLTRVREPVDEPAAWITTVVTRRAIDVLRHARVQRETYIGPWLPEPLIERAEGDPSERVELADSLSSAFLVVLERLTPLERAAFLLREVFAYEYNEIAAIIDRREDNCRQLVTRARKHVRSSRPRFETEAAQRRRLLDLFLAAAEDGDVAGLERVLAEDAVLYADGGGNVAASRHPLIGANRIARAVSGVDRTLRRRYGLLQQPVTVNGQPGVVRRTRDGSLVDVLSVDVVEGRIHAVRIVRNPEKLRHLRSADRVRAPS